MGRVGEGRPQGVTPSNSPPSLAPQTIQPRHHHQDLLGRKVGAATGDPLAGGQVCGDPWGWVGGSHPGGTEAARGLSWTHQPQRLGSTLSHLLGQEAGDRLVCVWPSSLTRAAPVEGPQVPEKQLWLSCLVLKALLPFYFYFCGFVSDYKGNILKTSGKSRKFLKIPENSLHLPWATDHPCYLLGIWPHSLSRAGQNGLHRN